MSEDKMSMLAILKYCEHTGKGVNPRIPNKSIKEMAAYQITK